MGVALERLAPVEREPILDKALADMRESGEECFAEMTTDALLGSMLAGASIHEPSGDDTSFNIPPLVF